MVHPHSQVASAASPTNFTSISPAGADSGSSSIGDDDSDHGGGDNNDDAVVSADRHRHSNELISDGKNMEYWMQRCSICFEAQLDLCLEYCRDQFCLDCFRRYVTNVVSSSWGLSVTKIRCPVCQDPIPQREWSRFVPRSVVDLYNRFNEPYRSFSRCCPECDAEIVPCERSHRGQPRRVHVLLKELITRCNAFTHRNYRDLKDLAKIYERQEWSSSTLLDVYKQTMIIVKQFERNYPHSNHSSAINHVIHGGSSSSSNTSSSSSSLAQKCSAFAISKEILRFDMKPDTWRKLQFAHISFFPSIDCSDCGVTFCLQCGNRDHPDVTCEEHMKSVIVGRKASYEMVETLRWQLEHSQRCPSCSIMIQRDEGCNKCGFYRCSRSPEGGPYMNNTEASELSNVKPELGVPNVSNIQARLYSGIRL
ncbi:hypothetical protein BX666DRAFT_2026790 [Dichotomocladium elegans]|nr:hypothetical protein BX666DRAFT_2026790 [Dichotomocladium elegans]